MLKPISTFIDEVSGLTFIEYALIAGLVSTLVVGTLITSGDILTNWFFVISGSLILGIVVAVLVAWVIMARQKN